MTLLRPTAMYLSHELCCTSLEHGYNAAAIFRNRGQSMPASQQHIDHHTPMGATLIPGGCTFRTWAPSAKAVYVGGSFKAWRHGDPELLTKDADGYWAGFVTGVVDSHEYKF